MKNDRLLRGVLALCGSFVLTACSYTLTLFVTASMPLAVAGTGISIMLWVWYWLWAGGGNARIVDRRLLVAGATVTAAACVIVKPHGAYDAWLHWNSLARYFSNPAFFRNLHRPESLWHADYPPGLTAPIGFIWRLIGSDPEYVPRVIGFLFYLAIPLLLCNAALHARPGGRLWLGVLALFTLNYECVSQGLNQYADIPLALYLLLALICWRAWVASGAVRWLVACSLMLGGCLLTKNEGAVLVAAFFLSRFQAITRMRRQLPALILPLVLPAVVLLLYKRYIPTPNDVVAGLGAERLRQLLDLNRYRIIGYNLLRFGCGRFPLFILFFAWVAWMRRRMSWRMSSDLLCILLCGLGYIMVYLCTEIGLEWLVPTSMNRLMMQLLPAGTYIAIRGLGRTRTVENSTS